MKVAKKQIQLLRWFCLFFLFFVTDIAYAQELTPLWRNNLHCDPNLQTYNGLEYCTATIHSDENTESSVHVIVVDLETAGVRVEYIISEGYDKDGVFGECRDVNLPAWSSGPGCYSQDNLDYYPVMGLLDAVGRYDDTAVVIDSDYGARSLGGDTFREHGPESFAVIRGQRIDGPDVGDTDNNAVLRPWLAVSNSTPIRAEIHKLDSDDGSIPYEWIYTGVGGAPWLIQNGEVMSGEITLCNQAPGSCYSGASQVAVGLTIDRRWLFLVLGVETPELIDLATFMREDLGVWTAFKFDGGGSAQLWYGGLPGNEIRDKIVIEGDGRELSQYLAIIAEPGNGINTGSDDEPGDPTPVDDDDDLGFFPRIINWFVDQVENIEDNITRQIAEWLRDLEQNAADYVAEWFRNLEQQITDFLEEQLTSWLTEFCGAALIPVGIVIVVGFRRRFVIK